MRTFLVLAALGCISVPAKPQEKPPRKAPFLKVVSTFTSTTKAESHTRAEAPDVNGAVGPAHIVEFLNGDVKVYDKKTGKLVMSRSTREFWDGVPGSGGAEANPDNKDPRLIWDALARRWYTSAQRPNGLVGDSTLIVARSDTGDPTGGWKAVTFFGDKDKTPRTFVDFDQLGVSPHAVLLSINQFKVGENNRPNIDGVQIFAIKKSDLNQPAPVLTMVRLDHLNDWRNVVPVADYDGTSGAGIFWGTSTEKTDKNDLLVRGDLTGDTEKWDLKRVTTRVGEKEPNTLRKSLFQRPMIAQPGGKEISSNGATPPAIRLVKGEFWVVHGTRHPEDDKRSALRWWRIRASDNAVLGEGVLSDPELSLFLPSIAVDGDGNIAIGCAGVSANQFLSAYAIGGRIVNGKAVFDPSFQLVKAGLGVHAANGRWGDYTTTVADPTEPATFWTFLPWAQQNGDWATEIAKLSLK